MKFREYLKVINLYETDKCFSVYKIFYIERKSSLIINFEAHSNHGCYDRYLSLYVWCIDAKRAAQFIGVGNQPSNKSDKSALLAVTRNRKSLLVAQLISAAA